MDEEITINISLGLRAFHQRAKETFTIDRETWEAMTEDEQEQTIFEYASTELIDFGWEVDE